MEQLLLKALVAVGEAALATLAIELVKLVESVFEE